MSQHWPLYEFLPLQPHHLLGVVADRRGLRVPLFNAPLSMLEIGLLGETDRAAARGVANRVRQSHQPLTGLKIFLTRSNPLS